MKSSLCRMQDSRKCGLMERYLQALLVHQGYTDDSLYGAGEEDGVCGGNHKDRGDRFLVTGGTSTLDTLNQTAA